LSREALYRAVLALPLRYREPVILFYFHEMDVAAAASTMGLPEGTLKARLSRARALLRQRFPHLDEEQAAHPSQRPRRMGHQDLGHREIDQETRKEVAN
jgi:DNA-directed RNA polymerase specialized sigma24 family protein